MLSWRYKFDSYIKQINFTLYQILHTLGPTTPSLAKWFPTHIKVLTLLFTSVKSPQHLDYLDLEGTSPNGDQRSDTELPKIKKKKSCPGWYGSLDWALVCKQKGHQFNTQSGHVPGFRGGSLAGGMPEATDRYICYTLMFRSLSPSLPISLKVNK